MKKVAALLLSLVICLLLAEIVTSLVNVTSTRDEYYETTGKPYPAEHSDYLPFTLRAASSMEHKTKEFDVFYHFDEHGYRTEVAAPPALDRQGSRVLLCGDSFTFGWGCQYEDSFAGRLDALLPDAQYAVINAGYHAGYSPDAYYCYLIKEGAQLKPTYLIVQLYENDLSDMKRNVWTELDANALPKRMLTLRHYMNQDGRLLHPLGYLDAYMHGAFRLPLLRNSELFIALSKLSYKLRGEADLIMDSRHFRNATEAKRDLRKSITGIEAWAQSQNIPLLWLPIPSLSNREAWQKSGQLASGSVYSELLQAIEDADGQHLDLIDRLQREDYFPEDTHLRPSGNRKIAEAIAAWVLKQG